MKRLKLEIAGRVQGIGFRPYLFKLAQKHHLTGGVFNTSGGVILQVQGERSNLLRFLKELPQNQPSQGRMERVAWESLPVVEGESAFMISASQEGEGAEAVLPPDLGTCELCRRELMDRGNRRYRYPFINCTECGPRFTIVAALPYDRPRTTMSRFELCEACEREYRSPLDRRFHAQPNACPRCGPRLLAWEPGRESGGPKRIGVTDPLDATVAMIGNGQLAAIKGLGGFHLAADAANQSAVERLRRVKGREAKPLAVMCRDLEQVEALCMVSEAEKALLTSANRPIVILRRVAAPQISLAPGVAPGQETLGVMLPYTPLHYLLLDALAGPVVLTSANPGEQPIPIVENEIEPALLRETAVVLTHDRPIEVRCDDSVVAAWPELILMRRSRGYVPDPLKIPDFRQALGVGADYKNTACLIRDRAAFFTQHIGNLDDEPARQAARQSLEHLRNLLGLAPEVVGCDLHPEYHSRAYALTLGLPVISVQHHHAHILACMAEHRLNGPVLGVAFDGTGYGADGTVWGGEFLVAEYTGFIRMASLRPLGMPGGEKAVREPWRMALSYLYEAFGGRIPEFPGASRLEAMGSDLLLPLLEHRFNSPLTTSAGRLFDGAAALCGLALQAAYEGEAAMALEAMARRGERPELTPYPLDLEPEEVIRLDWRAAIRDMVRDLREERPREEIAARFHLTVAEGIRIVCLKLRESTGIHQVALSGGVFQNGLLLSQTRRLLSRSDFEVYCHRRIPPNDGGIALGQAVYAAAAREG